MVGEHDAAGTDADGAGVMADVCDDDGSGGAGDAGDVVMFGDPEAFVAEGLCMAGEVGGVGEGLGGCAAGDDGAEVEDGKRDGGRGWHD